MDKRSIIKNVFSKDLFHWLQYYYARVLRTTPLVSDKLYVKCIYWIAFREKLDLDNPQTFSQKLQWLKVYYRNPIQTMMVDKYAVKKFIKESIGERYVVPVIGKWDTVEEIDWDRLPNRFVMKCNHDSGGLVICKDMKSFDVESAKKKIKNSLGRNLYFGTREWPYKDVKPCVFAEEYLEDEYGELRDYKFFCFDGEPKALFIATDRQSEDKETTFDFFDMNLNHLPFTNGHPNANPYPAPPKSFNEMRELAAKLSKGLPHVRVDFYEVNGRPYFGELTFFHWGGIKPFDPVEWDYKFGSWIKLPHKS